MKKWMGLVLCVLFVVTLAACNKQQEEAAAPVEQSQEVETPAAEQMVPEEEAVADEAAPATEEAEQAVEEATPEMPEEAK